MSLDTTKKIKRVLYNGEEMPLADNGGGSSEVTTGEYVCRVVDYDGSILKEEYHDTGDTFTLPSLPTHDGLIAQGYSSPVDIVDNQVTVGNSDLIFGVIYTTSSGLSEFDIELTKVTGLDVTLYIDGTKDWGDGTSNTETTHTYSSYGNYTITCDGTTIPMQGLTNYMDTYEDTYYYKHIRLAQGVSISAGFTFTGLKSLTYITIPNGITKTALYCFMDCCSLKSVILPNSVTETGGSSFSNCYSLKHLVIPNSVTKMGISEVAGCYALGNVVIPNSVTKMDYSFFSSCYSLEEIKIPKAITAIGTAFFNKCFGIMKYDFSTHEQVPTLGSTNAFTGINQIAKIIVPDSLYDGWIAATNWSTYADYIYKASEVAE